MQQLNPYHRAGSLRLRESLDNVVSVEKLEIQDDSGCRGFEALKLNSWVGGCVSSLHAAQAILRLSLLSVPSPDTCSGWFGLEGLYRVTQGVLHCDAKASKLPSAGCDAPGTSNPWSLRSEALRYSYGTLGKAWHYGDASGGSQFSRSPGQGQPINRSVLATSCISAP